MNINDIQINNYYLFAIPKQLFAVAEARIYHHPINGPSLEFANRYSKWRDIDNKVIIALSKRTNVKFFVQGDPVTCWASASAEYFMPYSSCAGKQGLCQCNLWLAGCNCGVFKAEQQPNTPKETKWIYIDD